MPGTSKIWMGFWLFQGWYLRGVNHLQSLEQNQKSKCIFGCANPWYIEDFRFLIAQCFQCCWADDSLILWCWLTCRIRPHLCTTSNCRGHPPFPKNTCWKGIILPLSQLLLSSSLNQHHHHHHHHQNHYNHHITCTVVLHSRPHDLVCGKMSKSS